MFPYDIKIMGIKQKTVIYVKELQYVHIKVYSVQYSMTREHNIITFFNKGDPGDSFVV